MKCRKCGKPITSLNELECGLCTKCARAFEVWNESVKKERQGKHSPK